MRASLCRTLVNSFLCYYDKEWLHSCPIEFKPKVYKRYIDDIFVMFWSRDPVATLVDYSITKYLNMRFKFEIEDQKALYRYVMSIPLEALS